MKSHCSSNPTHFLAVLCFLDFVQSLEGLNAEELMKMMRSFLSKGVAICQRGFERVADEAKASLEEKKILESENRILCEENEKLKEESHQLKDRSTKQQTAIDGLKQELEKSLQCYEECRTELKDMVTQYDAQQVQLEANANLIPELKKLKGELEDTLEKNEAYCHQWGAYLATFYRRALESFGAETQDFKITDNISSFVEWLHRKLKFLPDTMRKVGDYGAATCSEMLLHLLEQ
jgi:vacuolar-type H+-ATPase subunit I/STV1